ncbi:MAG TPA: lysylphosphatidylglycerol synthase domain-containing protein [Gemmatimonadales bacterium]|nr:lysylphosphatidylglycerol synthase domain-containing protein [Gemmatimonadales bacterium]
MRSGWVRVAQALVGLSIVLFAIRALVRNWDQLRSQPLEWQLRPGWLVLSLVLIWLMYALLILGWRSLLSGWGQRLDGWSAARIWILSSLGKYIPGKVWAVAGMALLSQRAGVAAWAATGSAVVMQVLAIGTGAAVAGLAGAHILEAAQPGARAILVLLIAGALLSVGLLLWPPFLRRLLRLAAPQAVGERQPSGRGIVVGIATNIVAWLGYGLALWLLGRGLLPMSGLGLRLAIAVFTASYLAGFLALFAPGGIGVREGLFILMLQGPLGVGAATSLALASRLLLTVAELGAAVPFLVFRRRQVRVPS